MTLLYATSVHTLFWRSPSGHSKTGAKCHRWSWRWHDAQLQEAGCGKAGERKIQPQVLSVFWPFYPVVLQAQMALKVLFLSKELLVNVVKLTTH